MDVDTLKSTLINALKDHAKECETKFGGRTLLATESEACVAKTIQLFERITQHGLKPKSLIPAFKNLSLNVNNFSFRQMSEIVSNGISLVMSPHGSNDLAVFWHFLRNHLTKHEQERYYHLQNVSTDYGRGRAWIRSSLNEHSLDRYLRILFSDETILRAYYESWSVMCDPEKQSAMVDIAKSLRSVIFALVVDRKDLENVDSCRILVGQPVDQTPSPVMARTPEVELVRPVKKSKPRIVEFAEEAASNPTLHLGSPSLRSESSLHSQAETETDKSSACCVSSSSESLATDSKKSSTLHPGELKQLLMQLTERKTAVEEELGNLKEKLKDSNKLRETLESQLHEQQENAKKLESQYAELNQENSILKEQLKKYVSAVQMLRKNSDVAPVPRQELHVPNDYYQEAVHFEEKLVQVAEMHGELMEFNSHLQKKLQMYETLANRYRAELLSLRGPLPSVFENESFLESASAGGPNFVHIWIPSTFLVNGTKETYHVYQVYLRISNDEWNIYRRYSQFYSLRKKFKKVFGEVGSLDFPPKRSFGQRDACVVEDRRKRLQDFLRSFINLWLTDQIRDDFPLTKDALVDAIPFFKEDDSD